MQYSVMIGPIYGGPNSTMNYFIILFPIFYTFKYKESAFLHLVSLSHGHLILFPDGIHSCTKINATYGYKLTLSNALTLYRCSAQGFNFTFSPLIYRMENVCLLYVGI